jgi:hypothetical protein
VWVVRPEGEERWPAEALGFGYRTSRLQHQPGVVTEVELELRPAPALEVWERTQRWLEQRGASQPVRLPSSGCVFRNPPGDAAGRLLELCGAKGMREGGVEVSTLHANYVVNTGGGRAEDVLRLIERLRGAGAPGLSGGAGAGSPAGWGVLDIMAGTGLSARSVVGYAGSAPARTAQSYMRGGPVHEEGYHVRRVGCA